MKKINYNFIVFAVSFALIVAGLISLPMAKGVAKSCMQFVTDTSSAGTVRAFYNFTDNMDKVTSENLSYHGLFMDINSVFMKITNTRVVEKDDTTVIKTSSDYLANPRPKIYKDDLKQRADRVSQVYNAAVANGAEFLYIMAPVKGHNMEYPANVTDYTVENCAEFMSLLEQNSIPNLSLIEKQNQQGISDEDMFFITDHHWKPEYGLWASGEICSELGRLYGFEYDSEINNIESYNVQVYEDWFLGSQGKKVGSYFTSLGRDDISLITPKFETSLTEEQPNKNHIRTGKFEDTALYMGNLETKDYYNLNPYVVYSGGDFREQIFTNHMNPHGKKVLLIRDSFSCAMAPFMALNTAKLYVADVRDYVYFVGNKIKVSEYIAQIKPDYVLIMYSGISSNANLFDFE